ncbi:MAG: glycosyltransferase family 2 protein [Nocardioides sp.]
MSDAMVMPRVSVVVPCHNYERYLDDALGSALGQEGVDLDVTIVDDASTDDSPAIARRWAEADPRVRVVTHATNRGHIDTFNHALESATAPYVVKLDPDDLLTPGSLWRAARAMRENSRLAFVYGRSLYFRGDPPQAPRRRVVTTEAWTGEEWIWRRARGGINVIRQPEVMIRRSALEEVGGHRPEIPEASDYHLWLRLATVGDIARIGGAVQGLYRVHPQSMQHTLHAGIVRDLRARATAFELFLDERGHLVDGAAEVGRRIRLTLAREAVFHALDAFDGARASSAPVDELRALAVELDRRVCRTRRWHELEHRIAAGKETPTPRRSPSRLARQAHWNHHLHWMWRYQR